MNQHQCIARLTADPDPIRHVGDNVVIRFRVAINGRGKDAKSVFVDCSAWNKTAEVVDKYLRKGSQVALVSELRLEEWEDKNSGQKRSKHILNVQSLTLLGSPSDDKDNNGEQDQEAPRKSASSRTSGNRNQKASKEPDFIEGEIEDNDSIPF